MTLSAQIPPPSSPPASCLNRCGGCAWWSRQTVEIGLCDAFDLTMRVDAVGCPSWRRAIAVVRRIQ